MEENDPVFRSGGKLDKPRLVLNHDSIAQIQLGVQISIRKENIKHIVDLKSRSVLGENKLTIDIECSVGCDDRTWNP